MVWFGPFKQYRDFYQVDQVDQVDQDFWQLGIGPGAAQKNPGVIVIIKHLIFKINSYKFLYMICFKIKTKKQLTKVKNENKNK